jgi:hypothetical protein
MQKVEIESIVIVKGEHGSVATLRFNQPRLDRFISGSSKAYLYKEIDKYLKKVVK